MDPVSVAFRSGSELDKPVKAIGVAPEFFEQGNSLPADTTEPFRGRDRGFFRSEGFCVVRGAVAKTVR
jgi:hypothetical protein